MRTAKSSMVMPLIFIGEMTPVKPNIAKILNTFEPNTLPIAMPLLPFFAATTLVASSGRDVPPATIVSPITASLTPSCCATKVAESTNRLLPIINPAKPPMINTTDFKTLVFANGSFSSSSPLFAFFNVNKRKPKKVAKRMAASILLMLPSKHNPSKSNDAKQAKGMSFRTVPLRIAMGVTTADTQ